MKLKSILVAFGLVGLLLLCSPTLILAQDNAGDNSFYQKAMNNTLEVYYQSFGSQSALYNGSKYPEYLFRFTEGHPFFYSSTPVFGSVVYDGIRYDSALMRYDEVTDVVVIHSGIDKLQLWSKRVSSFNLYNSDFIRIEKDSLSENLVTTGFYNILYQGKMSLLKKQIKTLREVISSTAELQHFADPKDYYYIKENDRFYPIKRKKDLYRLFGDRKRDVQQFVKANGLNFRRDRQNMLTKATAYYDSLKK